MEYNDHGLTAPVWITIASFGISIDRIIDDEYGIAKKIYMSVPEINIDSEGNEKDWKRISSNIKKLINEDLRFGNITFLSKPIKGLIWTYEMRENANEEVMRMYRNKF